MGLTGANALSRLNEIVTGDKFLREVELPLGNLRVTANGGIVGTGTAPTSVVIGTSFADGETAHLHFNVPQDYDEGVDICALRLHEVPVADNANTTDLGILAEQDIYRAGAAVDADPATAVAVAEAATANTGALVRENVLDISGRGYKPGDHVVLVLDANASAGELLLLSIDLIYSGDVAAFNDDDRFRDLG